ncbi:MAG: hypothetical protein JWQ30_2109 [Sediminibacterium sp.]|nr:hypothetical protein [Sediminibacterium sp.]
MKRNSILVTTALVLIAALLFTTCAKEYSYEGGNRPATSGGAGTTSPQRIASYTLPGTPNSCMSAKLNGVYIAAKGLDATNTVRVLVDVKSPGSYTLTTDTVDNIAFSLSGVFADTGINVISLQGNGSPILAQNLVFKLSGSNSSCTIPVSVAPPGIAGTYVLESDYDHTCAIHKVAGDAIVGQPLTTANTVAIHIYATYAGSYAISTKTLNGMMFYGTGVFTTTGYQYIYMTGTGIPLATGTTTFLTEIIGPHPLGGETCTFNITVQ